MRLNFGKYKGQTVENIVNKDIDYLIWILENIQAKKYSKLIDYIAELICDTEYYQIYSESKRLDFLANCNIYG
jgi:hypothetical protein